MAYHLNIIQLLLGVSVLCVSNPLRIYHVHVNIFVERSNAEIKNIAQKAIEFYYLDHGNISPENKIRLNLSLVTYDKVINRITNLDDDRFFNCNIKTTLCAAIFVQFSSHEIFFVLVNGKVKYYFCGIVSDERKSFESGKVTSLMLFMFFRLHRNEAKTSLSCFCLYITGISPKMRGTAVRGFQYIFSVLPSPK